jgi:hypothetical protein
MFPNQVTSDEKEIKHDAQHAENQEEVPNKTDKRNPRLGRALFSRKSANDPVRMRHRVSAKEEETAGNQNANDEVHDDVHVWEPSAAVERSPLV